MYINAVSGFQAATLEASDQHSDVLLDIVTRDMVLRIRWVDIQLA